MIEVRQTAHFRSWLDSLRDAEAKARILIRIRRVQLGNFGDAKFFDGIGELRINYGPGYQIYLVRRGSEIVILLCGGDKGSQKRDIKNAKALAEEL